MISSRPAGRARDVSRSHVSFAAFVFVMLAANGSARAQTAPAPAAPSPAPSATPLQGLHVTTDAGTSLIDQATAGEGQVGPEAAGFIKGSPLAPNTPYDLFSSAPLTPGVAGLGSILTHADYEFRAIDLGLTAGLGERC